VLGTGVAYRGIEMARMRARIIGKISISIIIGLWLVYVEVIFE
jgi:hypothetical protein